MSACQLAEMCGAHPGGCAGCYRDKGLKDNYAPREGSRCLACGDLFEALTPVPVCPDCLLDMLLQRAQGPSTVMSAPG